MLNIFYLKIYYIMDNWILEENIFFNFIWGKFLYSDMCILYVSSY